MSIRSIAQALRTALPVLTGSALSLTGAGALLLPAQTLCAETQSVDPYVVVVTANEASLRCGEAHTFYAVSTLKPGTLLRVDASSSGYLRVSYPQGTRAIVPATEASLSGLGVKLTKPSRLRAFNAAGGARSSWQLLMATDLPPGTVLSLSESIKDEDGKVTHYAVKPPAGARAFIAESMVRRATSEEAAALSSAEAKSPDQTKPDAPAMAPVKTETATASTATKPEARIDLPESKPAAAAPSTPAPVQPTPTKSAESKPIESKPAEIKPAQTKPAETQVDRGSIDAALADVKASAPKPPAASAPSPATKPVESKPLPVTPESKIVTTVAEPAPAAKTPPEPKPETAPAPTTMPSVGGKMTPPVIPDAPVDAPASAPVAPSASAVPKPAPVPAVESPATAPVASAPPTMEDLGTVYTRVQKQPLMEAELEPALDRFREARAQLGSSNADRSRARRLDGYIQALQLRSDLREAQLQSQNNDAALRAAKNEVAQRISQIQAQRYYSAIGRLLPSTIYDGSGGRVPTMYRIVSPEPGFMRTLGYLLPDPRFNYQSMLGQVVGVEGQTRRDEALKVNVYIPTRVETVNIAPSAQPMAPAQVPAPSAAPSRPAHEPSSRARPVREAPWFTPDAPAVAGAPAHGELTQPASEQPIATGDEPEEDAPLESPPEDMSK